MVNSAADFVCHGIIRDIADNKEIGTTHGIFKHHFSFACTITIVMGVRDVTRLDIARNNVCK